MHNMNNLLEDTRHASKYACEQMFKALHFFQIVLLLTKLKISLLIIKTVGFLPVTGLY